MQVKKIYKITTTKTVAIDESNKTIRFRVSDALPDRMNEIVEQSWDLKSFLANPLALWGHKSDEPENVIGTWSDFETKDDGSYATLHVDEDINPKASLIWKQLVKGTLRCVSVGFIPHSSDWDGDTQVLKDNELMEISVVPIPANPRAIALDYKAGAISKKDAAWLIKSMESEAAFIKKQMEVEQASEKENTMSAEDNKQMGAMMDAIASLAKSQEATNARLDTAVEKMTQAIAQKGAVSDILNADHSWEASEEKWMLTRDVSDIYWAFCEAFFYTATPASDFKVMLDEMIQLLQQVADGNYGDETGTGAVAKGAQSMDVAHVKELIAHMFAEKAAVAAPAAPETTPPADDDTDAPADADATPEGDKPASVEKTNPADANTHDEADKPADDKKTEEEDGNADDDADLAKGGKDDQPGATDGEIDDDTELTDEQQAELDAAIEEQYAASKA